MLSTRGGRAFKIEFFFLGFHLPAGCWRVVRRTVRFACGQPSTRESLRNLRLAKKRVL